MPKGYVEPRTPRFRIEQVDEVEQVTVAARRSWFVLAFLAVWLTLWTVGGLLAITQVLTSFDLFLAVWLCFWAVGWLYAAATVVWQLRGREVLRVVDRDLEIILRSPGFNRSRVYHGREIARLTAHDGGGPFQVHGGAFATANPLTAGRSGSVRFDYGARTVYAAAGLDEAEGRLIVAWLARRLPTSATSLG